VGGMTEGTGEGSVQMKKKLSGVKRGGTGEPVRGLENTTFKLGKGQAQIKKKEEKLWRPTEEGINNR